MGIGFARISHLSKIGLNPASTGSSQFGATIVSSANPPITKKIAMMS